MRKGHWTGHGDKGELYYILLCLQIKSFVKVFPTVFHGWTVRYDENDPEIVAKAEEAHKDMLDWYAKYLPVTATETTTSSSSATATLPKTIKELLPAKLID